MSDPGPSGCRDDRHCGREINWAFHVCFGGILCGERHKGALVAIPDWPAQNSSLLAQKARYVARHFRLHSRTLRRSFARLLGAGTARGRIQIGGSLISERGIGQHAVDTVLPLGGDNDLDRGVCRLSPPFLFHRRFMAHCSTLSLLRSSRYSLASR